MSASDWVEQKKNAQSSAYVYKDQLLDLDLSVVKILKRKFRTVNKLKRTSV